MYLASSSYQINKNFTFLSEFFKKLIETDAEIRKLKQTVDSNYLTDVSSITDRFKRSLRFKHRHTHKKPVQTGSKKTDTGVKEHDAKSKNKTSLHANNASVIIEEKILINYEPERRRNFPKCSHTHETKDHEKQLKHPYHKNSQRIDEMLDTYKASDDKNDNSNINKILVTEKDDKKNSNEVNTKAKNTKERKFVITDFFANNDETIANQTNVNSFTDSTDSVSDVDYDVEVILATTPDVSFSSSKFV